MTAALVGQAIEAAASGELVLYLCDRDSRATDRFNEIGRMAASRADVSRIQHSAGDQRITFTSGGRIVFTATDRNAGRGFSPDVLILDEARDTIAVQSLAAVSGRVLRAMR